VDIEFFKERAERCRALAERADPFIKRRLLDLAARYDGRFIKASIDSVDNAGRVFATGENAQPGQPPKADEAKPAARLTVLDAESPFELANESTS
jgi:hypothetical protein